MKEEINLNELSGFLMKKLKWIITLTLLGLGISSIYTFYIAVPMYSSTTQILVDQRSSESGLSTGDINTNIKLIDTYKELITGPAILGEVKEHLGSNLSTNELAKKITIEAPENVQLFNVIVTETNPEKAALIANTVAQTFQGRITEIMQNIDNVVIVYEAIPNPSPVSPNIRNNIIRGLLFGAMIGLGIVLLQFFLDDTLRNTNFVTEDVGWNNLGSIFEVKSQRIPKENKALGSQVLEKNPSSVGRV